MDAPQWELLSRAPVFTHPRLQLVEDTVELPSNESATYLREPPGAHDTITVIATDDDGWLLVQRGVQLSQHPISCSGNCPAGVWRPVSPRTTRPPAAAPSGTARVADQLLGQLGVGDRKLRGEVRRRCTRPGVQPVRDLVGEHVAAPAVLDRRRGVPVPRGPLVELVHQHRDMPPGQLRNGVLRDSVGNPAAKVRM